MTETKSVSARGTGIENPRSPPTFREAFIEAYGCAEDAFERAVFWRCLYRHAIPFAWIILLIRRNFFQNDFNTIRQLAILRQREEILAELDSFSYANKQHGGVLKNSFRIRVSGQRLMRLYSRLSARKPAQD